MIVRTRLTPAAVEAQFRLWIEPAQRVHDAVEGWFNSIDGQPQKFVGQVTGGTFALRQRRGHGVLVWCPVASGRIEPAAWGSELHITIRPAMIDLLRPVSLLVAGAYGTWRFGDALPVLVFVPIAVAEVVFGWTIGVRRIQHAVSAWVGGTDPEHV